MIRHGGRLARATVGLGTLAFLLLVGLLVAPSTSAHPTPALPVPATGGHYLPAHGDSLSYSESILVDYGFGDFSGYVSHTYDNGTLAFNTTEPNGTSTVSYQDTGNYYDSDGNSYPFGDHGNFTFSVENYSYANGNDLDLPEPLTVWFYINNTATTGASLDVLNTPLTVVSADQGYATGLSSTGYAQSIFAEGTGTTTDDYFGFAMPASYTYMAYFDPTTGYILGDQYIEQDNNNSGSGFTYIDTVQVTSASFHPTTTAAPATAPVTLSVAGSGCSALLAWGNYTNGQSVSLQPGATYLLAAYPCNGASFQSWSTTTGSLASSSSSTTYLTVGSSGGTVTATFKESPTPFPWGVVIVLVFFVIILVLIIWLIVRARRHRSSHMARHSGSGALPYSAGATAPSYAGPAPLNLTPSDQPGVQQIVIKETVKVPCQYCGTLIDSTATACPKCGAPRT